MRIYKTLCIYYAPGIKCEKKVQKVYIIPKMQEKGPFIGNSYFHRDTVKKIYHLRQSDTCRNIKTGMGHNTKQYYRH